MNIFVTLIIFGHCCVPEVEFLHVIRRKILLGKYLGNFAAAIGSIIKTKHHVAIFYGCHRFLCSVNNDSWFNKFVRFVLFVRLLNRGNTRRRGLPLSSYHTIVSQLHSFPALVAIHGIITAADSCDFANSRIKVMLQITYKMNAAFRVCVPAVSESMHVNFVDILCLTQ